MSPQSVSKTSKSLEGLHGVHVVSHSPFAFEGISQVSSFQSSDARTKQSLFIERVWQQRPPCLRPIHCCIHGDQSLLETAANVITSLPFIFLGMQTPRSKLKHTEMECEYLKKLFGSLKEQNRQLQKEVEELRALKPVSASVLTMCPRCERVTVAADNGSNAVEEGTALRSQSRMTISSSSTLC
ncbi:hypothetical protein F2Q69_00051352 [Brassica cretica]|uniref:Leucine zipper homeobox-associated domain-containing protein n=3 Tax=Brassica cretica TaxID=69181 RepID=A0A8S9PUZ6_BRACR|nr:hypothetical protein F2Q69_00051352 [Brassica cretica]